MPTPPRPATTRSGSSRCWSWTAGRRSTSPASSWSGSRSGTPTPRSSRNGTKGPLKAEFAAVRVRVADGPVAARGRHLPGEEAWLVGEHRATGERKYYLSNLPADAALEALAVSIKARWVCEQLHQQLKEELGLDHFEGRSWRGLHHHALLCQLAFAFLQHLRLGGKRSRLPPRRTTAPAEPARHPAAHPGRAHPRPPALPALPAALRPFPTTMRVAG